MTAAALEFDQTKEAARRFSCEALGNERLAMEASVQHTSNGDVCHLRVHELTPVMSAAYRR